MKHYLQYEIHHSKYYLQKYFETCPIISNITTNCPRTITSIEVQKMMEFHYLPKIAPPAEGELKPNYSNSNKLILKMLKTFKT